VIDAAAGAEAICNQLVKQQTFRPVRTFRLGAWLPKVDIQTGAEFDSVQRSMR
jgi:hypothetical protein